MVHLAAAADNAFHRSPPLPPHPGETPAPPAVPADQCCGSPSRSTGRLGNSQSAWRWWRRAGRRPPPGDMTVGEVQPVAAGAEVGALRVDGGEAVTAARREQGA